MELIRLNFDVVRVNVLSVCDPHERRIDQLKCETSQTKEGIGMVWTNLVTLPRFLLRISDSDRNNGYGKANVRFIIIPEMPIKNQLQKNQTTTNRIYL